jgi:hypothetical protein
MSENMDGEINNAGSDPDSGIRRSGGSANDPHGGHEHLGHERRAPEPDPIEEMVPGGQGAEAAPYSRAEVTARMARIGATQEGFGGDADPILRGGDTDSADPEQLPPAVNPLSSEGRLREGMVENDEQAGVKRQRQTQMADYAPASLAFTKVQKPNLGDR